MDPHESRYSTPRIAYSSILDVLHEFGHDTSQLARQASQQEQEEVVLGMLIVAPVLVFVTFSAEVVKQLLRLYRVLEIAEAAVNTIPPVGVAIAW